MLGGIGEINFGKQYRQGNRVYDSNAIAMCLTAQPLGNAGGYSYLYAVGAAVQKDSLVVKKHNPTWIEKKYVEFYEKHGYIPEYFEPYNCREIKDYAPTLTTKSHGDVTKCGSVLITEISKEKKS